MDHRPGPDFQIAARAATSVNTTHSNAPLTPEGRRRLAALVADDAFGHLVFGDGTGPTPQRPTPSERW